MKDYDVIIIGTGIGGLACAGILVSKGLKVLMLEKNPTPGGYLTSFKRKGFVFDSAVYCFSGLDEQGAIRHLLQQLDVENEISFLRVDPIGESIFPGMRITLSNDIHEYKENLKQLFPKEKNLDAFFNKLIGIYSHISTWSTAILHEEHHKPAAPMAFLEYGGISYKELLDSYVHDEKLKSLLSDRVTFLGLSPSKISALSTVLAMMSHFISGAYRPVGGCQRLPDGLVSGIRKKGGEVIFKKEASQIITRGNMAVGVKTTDGTEYTADFIVSNIDYTKTFSIIGDGKYSFSSQERFKEYGVSTSFFILYLGIGGKLNLSNSAGNISYYPSFDLETAFDVQKQFTHEAQIGISIPTMADKTIAPPNSHIVIIHQLTDYDYVRSWKEEKKRLTEQMIKQTEALIPGIRDKAVHIEAATPATLERYTANYKGAAYGWQQVPWLRPMRTGIENLYLAGHWDGLGGGVIAATYSGIKTAREILRKVQ